MLLTIALLTKNSESTVRFALRSIYRQKIPDNVAFELVVVDGYSKDNTLNIVAKEIQKLKEKFRNQFIRHIIVQERVGIGYARSLALKEAQGDWILWIDSDNFLAQDYVLKAINEVEKASDKNIVVLYPQRVISVPRKRNFASRLIICYGKALADQSSKFFTIAKRLLSERLKGSIQGILPYTAMQGTFCNIEALCKVGGFNPYLIAAEDVDVFLKLISNGYKMRSFNSTLYSFTRDSLRAWFRQAVTWEYGKTVMYIILNNVSSATKFGIEDLVMKSRNSRNVINHIVSLIAISMNALHLCNPLIASLISLVYIYRRLGFIIGRLHAYKQRDAINRLILLKVCANAGT